MVCSTRQEVLLECACSPVVRTPAQWNAVCSRFDCVQKWEGVLVTVFTMADAAACARADSQHVGTGAVHVQLVPEPTVSMLALVLCTWLGVLACLFTLSKPVCCCHAWM